MLFDEDVFTRKWQGNSFNGYISGRQLSRLFLEKTGFTFSAYVRMECPREISENDVIGKMKGEETYKQGGASGDSQADRG